ncbi:MAG: SDR family NAD(P)-dependent oxidoreductase [Bacteroidales bacterium]|nr:SDR family NAD(P)-dependent oxidoreductase [Bacteroidales bacterium]
MIQLKDKTALITGGGTGIGQSIALHLAKEGCHLVLTGLGIEELNKTKAACEQFGVKAYAIETQLDDYTSIDRLYEYVMEQGLRIDLFVLNAGISQRDKAFDTDISIDEKILKIDFLSGVYLVKKFKDMILASEHVQISVTTSLSGLFGFPLRSAYCAAKHALFGFYESLELEYDNINVTFLIPGRINTQISKSALHGDGTAHAKMDAGQANGMSVERCGAIAVKAIKRQKHRKLIGRGELLMAYIHKYCLGLYYKLSRKISAT